MGWGRGLGLGFSPRLLEEIGDPKGPRCEAAPPRQEEEEADGAVAYLRWIALDAGLIIWPPVRRRLGQKLPQHNRWALRGPGSSALLQEDEEEDAGSGCEPVFISPLPLTQPGSGRPTSSCACRRMQLLSSTVGVSPGSRVVVGGGASSRSFSGLPSFPSMPPGEGMKRKCKEDKGLAAKETLKVLERSFSSSDLTSPDVQDVLVWLVLLSQGRVEWASCV
ncbi:unnamed protein product [Pleuronectes platessa]|uniref:Uncharacterized protein n=1 Tax=Pleuronectes platessa TaxID=8262 RepID=A0A9N7VZA5_PLEPL|nr:unnamed protein product [Pleuronectes platessa]